MSQRMYRSYHGYSPPRHICVRLLYVLIQESSHSWLGIGYPASAHTNKYILPLFRTLTVLLSFLLMYRRQSQDRFRTMDNAKKVITLTLKINIFRNSLSVFKCLFVYKIEKMTCVIFQ